MVFALACLCLMSLASLAGLLWALHAQARTLRALIERGPVVVLEHNERGYTIIPTDQTKTTAPAPGQTWNDLRREYVGGETESPTVTDERTPA